VTSPRRASLYPSLYQINTRVLTYDLGQTIGRPATLDDISDRYLDQLATQGFEWIWFLGVWQTGVASREVSRKLPNLQQEFRELLPDFTTDDICGSCFAITAYEVHQDFGGNAALERLRARLRDRGLKLMLDFIPNHTALDHPWVSQHPEYYIQSDEAHLQQQPQNYIRINVGGKPLIFAHGRDPYFPGWSDTLQLNYAQPAFQKAMLQELQKVADRCDGVRCDMAMLILPDVFEKTWGQRPEPFWPKATAAIHSARPDFIFMAEVYWDLEWTLQQQGFDYTYDKRLYDRLRQGQARPVREHFLADIDFQRKSARFLENHDEPRAAATFPLEQHRAAAVVTFLCPGLRFFHDGQFEGRTKHVPVHLRRRPAEKPNRALVEFYANLLDCVNLPIIRDGAWQLLNCKSAWDGNWTVDCFVCFAWHSSNERIIVVVNYAPNQSQCYLQLPFDDISGKPILLRDLMSEGAYERDGSDLAAHGLYLDLPPWGYNVFHVTSSSPW
jgi:Alpha amylase, catalytic domain